MTIQAGILRVTITPCDCLPFASVSDPAVLIVIIFSHYIYFTPYKHEVECLQSQVYNYTLTSWPANAVHTNMRMQIPVMISALGYWTSFLCWLFSFSPPPPPPLSLSLSLTLSHLFLRNIVFKCSHDIDGLVPERRNSSTITQELRIYCLFPSISLDIEFQHNQRHCRMEKIYPIGPSQYKYRMSRYGIPIMKVRRSRNRLIFIKGILIGKTTSLYWDSPLHCKNR